MNIGITPFPKPIYVTKPTLPELSLFTAQLKKIWKSRKLTNLGPYHRSLEEHLKIFLEVPHLSLVNNGTTALLLAMRALELSGQVIVSPFTFPATIHALVWSGLEPVFCDIDPISLTVNPDRIESLITAKTSAILGVHIYGTPCRVQKINHLARRSNLQVFYDAAHAFGVRLEGKGIGNYGRVSVFSFHATKSFHTIEGAAITMQEPALKKKVKALRNFGIENEELVSIPGINGKMNEIQAALGLLLLKTAELERKKRRALWRLYQEELSGVKGLVLLPTHRGVKSNFQFAVVRIIEKQFGLSRDQVYQRFKLFNVHTRKYFYPLCSDYPCYRDLPSAGADQLPVANQVAGEVLCLPLYGDLSPSEVIKIAEILKKFRRNT